MSSSTCKFVKLHCDQLIRLARFSKSKCEYRPISTNGASLICSVVCNTHWKLIALIREHRYIVSIAIHLPRWPVYYPLWTSELIPDFLFKDNPHTTKIVMYKLNFTWWYCATHCYIPLQICIILDIPMHETKQNMDVLYDVRGQKIQCHLDINFTHLLGPSLWPYVSKVQGVTSVPYGAKSSSPFARTLKYSPCYARDNTQTPKPPSVC